LITQSVFKTTAVAGAVFPRGQISTSKRSKNIKKKLAKKKN
jgi:hypothetical protein